MPGGGGDRLGVNHRRARVRTRSWKEDVGPAKLVIFLDVMLGTLSSFHRMRQENCMIRYGC